MNTLQKMVSALMLAAALAVPVSAQTKADLNKRYIPDNKVTQSCVQYAFTNIIKTNKSFSSMNTNDFNQLYSYIQVRIRDHEESGNLDDSTRKSWQDLQRKYAELRLPATDQATSTNKPKIEVLQSTNKPEQHAATSMTNIAALTQKLQQQLEQLSDKAITNISKSTEKQEEIQANLEQEPTKTNVYGPLWGSADNIRNKLNENGFGIPNFDAVTPEDMKSNFSNRIVEINNLYINPLKEHAKKKWEDYIIYNREKILNYYSNNPVFKQNLTIDERLEDIKLTISRDKASKDSINRCVAHLAAISMLPPETLEQYKSKINSELDEISKNYNPRKLKDATKAQLKDVKEYEAYFKPVTILLKNMVNAKQQQ